MIWKLLLAGSFISMVCFIVSLWNKIRMYRLLWINVGHKWELEQIGHRETRAALRVCRADQEATIRTAWDLGEALGASNIDRAKLRRIHTEDAKKIDSLMHGDRSCVLGHRYYTGEGISCPWCGAAEKYDKVEARIEMDAARFRAGVLNLITLRPPTEEESKWEDALGTTVRIGALVDAEPCPEP